jgi:phosphate transport system substrate-binding protein
MKMHKLFLSSALLILFSIGCKKANDNAETIIKGATTIVVDESILPIAEDEVAVFENKYNAKITLVPQSEAECINSLTSGKVSIAILSRKLSEAEAKVFRQKKIQPRETAFATDGIALIRNKNTTDSLIALSSVIDFLKQKPSAIKGLVFDNPNSSTVSYFKNLAQLNAMPTKNVFSFNTNNQVIKYVAENEGMVGIIGLNWLMQPTAEVESLIGKITILKIKDSNKQNYYYPTQDNIAGQDYPLARDLYIVNCQGGEGLGMGFASFLAGQIGQRIVLKSGLVPKIMPGRNIRVQN